MEGSGKVVVTAVGINSQAGIIFTLLGAVEDQANKEDKKRKKEDPEEGNVIGNSHHAADHKHPGGTEISEPKSPTNDEMVSLGEGEQSVLQAKLTNMAIQIGYGGMAVSLLTVIILCIQFSVRTFIHEGEAWKVEYINNYVRFVIIGVTVLVVAVPEGLSLAVTLSLAYSVKKMMSDNNLVRHLDACETMGNATTICSDKTGTLTTNRMTVVQAYVCSHHYKPNRQDLPKLRDLPQQVGVLITQGIAVNSSYSSDVKVSGNQQYVELAKTGAGVTQNSTGSAIRWEQGTCNASFRDEAQKLRQKDQKANGKKPSADPSGLPQQIGNKTECAML